MHTSAKNAYGDRRHAPVVLSATETESFGEIVVDLARATARFAGKVSLVESTAARAASKLGWIGQILVDLD